jgi:hypothetical protein
MMLKKLPAHTLEELGLAGKNRPVDLQRMHYLSKSQQTEPKGVDDRGNFDELIKSL